MDRDLNSIVLFVQNKCQSLLDLDCELYLDSKWASTYSQHRLKIRRQVYKKTKDKTVLDLDSVPCLKIGFVSISHCPVMGGFIFSKQRLGFDLEQYQRLSTSLIDQISFSEEQILCRDSFKNSLKNSIWTIKESVYKLYGVHEGLMSQVKILDLKKIPNQKVEEKSTDQETQEKGVEISLALCTYKDIRSQTLSFVIPSSDLVISISRRV